MASGHKLRIRLEQPKQQQVGTLLATAAIAARPARSSPPAVVSAHSVSGMIQIYLYVNKMIFFRGFAGNLSVEVSLWNNEN